MRTVTLTSLKTQVLQHANMEGTTFVDQTTELVGYINNSITELQDILIQKFGDDYFQSSSVITTDGVNAGYNLPSDFFKLLGVDLTISSTDFISLRPYMFSERNRYKTSLARTVYGLTNIRYRLQGNQINFIPLPPTNQTITLWYAPVIANLSSGSDTLDGVNGFEEYVIVDAAIKCLIKEESDTSQLMQRKQDLLRRIEAAAENRDPGMNYRVTDVTSMEYDAARLFDMT